MALRVYDAWDTTTDRLHSGGSRAEPIEIETDGLVDDRDIPIADGASATLWNASTDPFDDYELFWFTCDQDLTVTVTVGADSIDLEWPANRPFRLFAPVDLVVVDNDSGEDATVIKAVVT